MRALFGCIVLAVLACWLWTLSMETWAHRTPRPRHRRHAAMAAQVRRGLVFSTLLALPLVTLWAVSTYSGGPVAMRASWYGAAQQGRITAGGALFDRWACTAAHRTLPLGTRLHCVHPRSHRWVDVTVTDRGPFVPGRDLDLSEQAARQLRIEGQGVAWVQVTVMGGAGE